jgi:putative flippase GtrA
VSVTALSRLEVVRYAAISAVAFVFDLALLTLLAQRLGVHYLVAASISFLVGGVVAYFLSVRFVFRFRRVQTRSLEGATFVALGLAGLAVNIVVMALLVGNAGTSIVAAKVVAAAGTFGVNFLLRKFVLFTP